MVSLVAVVVCAVSGAQVPEDVGRVRSLMEAAHAVAQEKGEISPAFETALAEAVTLLSQERLGEELRSIEPRPRQALADAITAMVRARLDAIPQDVGLGRTEALEALVRQVTAGLLSRDVVDAWLGFPPTAPPTAVDAEMATQVSLQALIGDLVFQKGSAQVLDEVGTAGAGNKLIDRGEWVLLAVSFRNAGNLPWFSTTATIEPASEYLYTEKRQVAPELGVGAEGALSMWVYVSATCPATTAFSVRFADTHRGKAAGFTLALRPINVLPPRLVSVDFDTDGLGSSDDTKAVSIQPGQRFELSGNFELAPGVEVNGALLEYRLPAALRSLFRSLEGKPTALVADKTSRRLWRAGDDLDATVADKDSYPAAVAASPQGQRWLMDVARGRVWVAFDVTLTVPISRVAQEGTARTGRVGRRPGLATEPTPEEVAWPAPRVIELAKRFMRLVPHPVKPELPASVSAVSGYELVFDERGFTAEYEKRPPALTPAPVAPTATSTFRTYRWLGAPVVKPTSPEPPPLVASDPAPVPVAPPAPPPEPSPERALVRLDLGLGATLYGVRGAGSWSTIFNGATVLAVPTASLRAFIGRSLSGFLGVSFAGAAWPWVGHSGVVAVAEYGAEVGLAYRFFPGLFEVTPWLGADLRVRTANLGMPPGVGFGLLGGVNVGVHASRHLSFFLDLGGRLSPSPLGSLDLGPTASAVILIDPSGGRLLAGASWSF